MWKIGSQKRGKPCVQGNKGDDRKKNRTVILEESKVEILQNLGPSHPTRRDRRAKGEFQGERLIGWGRAKGGEKTF